MGRRKGRDVEAFVLTVGVAVVVFATTNVDDMLILSAFFADPSLAHRSVVIGQFCGIAALTLLSVTAALLAVVVPPGWIALLGFAPLGIGLVKLRALYRQRWSTEADELHVRVSDHGLERSFHSQILSVAAVTAANGGDNLGVYIPLFASSTGSIPLFVAVFTVMTALWCVLAYLLVNNRLAGRAAVRFGHVVLPFVLIALGLRILSGAVALLG